MNFESVPASRPPMFPGKTVSAVSLTASHQLLSDYTAKRNSDSLRQRLTFPFPNITDSITFLADWTMIENSLISSNSQPALLTRFIFSTVFIRPEQYTSQPCTTSLLS